MNRESWPVTSREDWLNLREGYADVTASNIGCLFEGADPYSRIESLLDHVNRRRERRETTPSQRAGLLAEAMFPQAVREVHPEWEVIKASSYHRVPALRIGCTPDFWLGPDDLATEPGLLQAKTCSARVWEEWRGRPPLSYTLQTLFEMIVTGRPWGILGIIVRSDLLPLHLFEVPRHPEAEGRILDAVANFWAKVDAGEFPEPAPADGLAAMLDDGSHIDLSGDNRLPEWLERREHLMNEIREADRSKKGIEYEIKQRMAGAATGWLDGWEISFRAEHRKGFTVEPSDPRVLRVKRTKEMEQ